MHSLCHGRHIWQPGLKSWLLVAVACTLFSSLSLAVAGEKLAARPVLENPAAVAASEAEMKPYTEIIAGKDVPFDMVPIPGGTFIMGSPPDEADRGDDEGPQHEVKIDPFWMGKCEVRWDEYDVFTFQLDIQLRELRGIEPTPMDNLADALSRPTKPYTDMTFGMGQRGFPAICMTQLAAKRYCEWLSAKTGRYYRLPTEAEWEYACRAGSQTAYHFGDDPDALDEYGWYYDNSQDKYQKVGKKKPNAWGLHDMHGNVAEWVLDAHNPDGYPGRDDRLQINPLVAPRTLYSRIVRGGSWFDDPDLLRSAARVASERDWKMQDPQLPQSIWYHTDADFVGFRVVRPLVEPTEEEKQKYAVDKIQDYKTDGRQ